jgi:hypothetical protein
MAYSYRGWRADNDGSWSKLEVQLGDEPVEDVPGFLVGQGYRELGAVRPGVNVYTSTQPPPSFQPYVVLVDLGDEPVWIGAAGLPALTHALRALEALGDLPGSAAAS